ncbi:MAG: hypothetical protein Q4E24_01455 [bacterium]|nr:hypothetical protein [bacterium]
MEIMLFSEDTYFIELFSTYAAQNCQEFQMAFFSNVEKAMVYLEEHGRELEAVVATTAFWRKNPNKDENLVEVEIGNHTRIGEEGRRAVLNIYQPGTDIIGDLKKILVALSQGGITFHNDRKEKIITFFSTEGGSGKTTLAYMLALQLAKTGQTAYFNLEENPYIEHLYHQEYETKMEDILFALKDRRSLASVLVSGLKKNNHNVYTLPLMQSVRDFAEIGPADVELLLESMIELENMEYLVLDVSSGFSPLNKKILEMSDAILMVYSSTVTGRGKKERFVNDPGIRQLSYRGRIRYILNKCHYREDTEGFFSVFPDSKSIEQGMSVIDALNQDKEFGKGCAMLTGLLKGEIS